MERKNTILLTVIAVATLLVAVVGATFAYFTATTTTSGSAGEGTTGQTAAKAEGATLDLGTAGVERQLDYPGGFAYVGASATATKTNADDTNDYDLTFKVNYTISNQTKTELTYTLYKTNAAITNARTCQLVQKTNADDNSIPAGETRSSFECNGTNTYGTKIASGKVAASTDGTTPVTVTQASETSTGEGNMAQENQTLATKTHDSIATTAYYYLVIDYPNSSTVDQSNDQGKTISAQINGVGNLSSVKQTTP